MTNDGYQRQPALFEVRSWHSLDAPDEVPEGIGNVASQVSPSTPALGGVRLAVIGSGVAGLAAAYAGSSGGARVTLLEADDRLGGHAHTHDVVEGDRILRIDTGFIVHNRRTYPTLLRIFEDLGVATQPSEMSMSIVDEPSGVEWAGARGVGGVLPSWSHARDRAHVRMLTEIPRFHRAARRLLAESASDPRSSLVTMDEFVRGAGFSERLRTHFIEPLIAAVWSCDPDVAGRYPALYLFRFLSHHGMLSVTGSPTWRTVTGGSRTYVDALAERLRADGGDIRVAAPVASVRSAGAGGGVEITVVGREPEEFDGVVIATHPHQALAMLAEPSAQQVDVLSALTYSPNRAVLHTDTALMPANRRTWSSWNFRRRADGPGHVTVTYDLTRLQRLATSTRYLVTLGGSDLIDPSTVIAEMEYEHPLYTPSSVAAQARLGEIEEGPVSFAGAYHGWGFHEDGAASGVGAVERLRGRMAAR